MISISDFADYYRRLARRAAGGPSSAEAQRDYRDAVGQMLSGFQRSF